MTLKPGNPCCGWAPKPSAPHSVMNTSFFQPNASDVLNAKPSEEVPFWKWVSALTAAERSGDQSSGAKPTLGSVEKRGSVIGCSSSTSGQPYQPPGVIACRSSPPASRGRLPRTSAPLLATNSAPLNGESSGENCRAKGLRKPHATIWSPVPSVLAFKI